MKQSIFRLTICLCLAFFFGLQLHAQSSGDVSRPNRDLAATILSDSRLDTIQARALVLLHGFNAGTSYGEVWIRDFNTFINGSMKVQSPQKVREMLLLFFKLQGDDGDIVDGFIDSTKAYVGYKFRYSPLAPGWAAHKNTVETDQESSLIQAMRKYIEGTGDTAVLNEVIGGKTVISRMEAALQYILKYRWSDKYGLITGATTVDWGDVQPERGWGVSINDHTKWAIDIYDNAMYAMAIHDFLAIKPRTYRAEADWTSVAERLKRQARKWLWKPAMQKYIPHLYLNGSPFPASVDEDKMLFTGGSACAILAGFSTKAEIAEINRQMVTAAAKEPHATIGITVYPPYPDSVFPNMKAYVYQNAGDWTWFGGRMITALVQSGYVREAWDELQPMIARTLRYNGFFEWYDVRTGEPKGSGDFRGEAGVYYDAITALRQWAKGQSSEYPNLQEIIVVYKSHFDIGYTHLASEVIRGYQTTTIDNALNVVEKNKNLPPEQQFTWTIPGWPMKKILENWNGQTQERRDKVLNAFKTGRFAVHALPFSMQTELQEPEGLVRSLGFASQLARNAGKPIPIAAKMTDVPCHSWILPTLLKNAGVNFLHLGCNPGSSYPVVPMLFWWQGPDDSRLLTMYSVNYGSELLPPKNWKYKTWLAMQMRGDNAGPPSPDEVRKVIDEIHSQLPNVKVTIGRLDDFANAILQEKLDIPVVKSDMPDTWIHGPMCDPVGVKLSRQTLPDLSIAEDLQTLLNTWRLPQKSISEPLADAYENSILYYEHTWGGSMYWISKYLPPKNYLGYTDNWKYDSTWQTDLEKGRFNRLQASWEEHTDYARNANAIATSLVKEELKTLSDNVKIAGPKTVVFNPLPWRRKDIPGLGYKAFAKNEPLPSEGAAPVIHQDNNSFENKYFIVKLNPQRGSIESLVSKKTKNELVDRDAPQGFAQLLYQQISENEVRKYDSAYIRGNSDWAFAEIGKPNMPPAAELPYKELYNNNCDIKFSLDDKDAVATLTYQPTGNGLHFPVTTKIILHGDEPYIDIEMTIEKPATPRPEDVWICFPFKINDPRFRVGRNGSVIDPVNDINVAGVNRYMYAVGSGVAVFSPSGAGAGVCGLDCPLVSLGIPGDWKFDNTYIPKKPTVFYNLFNNHWSTNYRFWNGGKWTYRFRIWDFEKYNTAESLIAPAFEARYPLQVVASDSRGGELPAEKKGISLSRKGVLVTAFGKNPDGDGTILRVWEQAGNGGSCQVALPLESKYTTATPVNLRGEKIGNAIKIVNHVLSFNLNKYEPKSFVLR
ncbi:MAG: hypothetical protein J0H07_21850 [Sphingobacteriales bacterium]|nr:hypothetical protein [Sphingobacteriales bacterium]